jgi:hypothetical protein
MHCIEVAANANLGLFVGRTGNKIPTSTVTTIKITQTPEQQLFKIKKYAHQLDSPIEGRKASTSQPNPTISLTKRLPINPCNAGITNRKGPQK